MGASLYWSAYRASSLGDEERRVVERRLHYANLSNPRVAKLFEGWGADSAESFELVFDQSPGEVLSGATKLPTLGRARATMHWLELLANLRRAVRDARWEVRVEGEVALWDSVDESYDLPGLAEALSLELREESGIVTVADKAAIGRSVAEEFAAHGFRWQSENDRMERDSEDIKMSLWFRPLANNAEVHLEIRSAALQEWLARHRHRGSPTDAQRRGLIHSCQLQLLDHLLGGGPFPWERLSRATAERFRRRVSSTFREHGLAIDRMYRSRPDELVDLHERLGTLSAELLQFFVWRERPDLAERQLTSMAGRMSADQRKGFLQQITDPTSTENPLTVAAVAHSFGLRPSS
ncbi:MAG: hypothetical protein AAF567_18035 [Actinomycetota bacterium]